MPNWCENVLTVTGEESVVKEFVDSVKQVNEDEPDIHYVLNYNIHVPVDFNDRDAVRQSWGTTYAVDESDGGEWDIVEDGENTQATLDFYSPWSPPTEWLITTASLIPGLHFYLTYKEPGVGFGGVVNVQGNQIFENSSYEIDASEDLDSEEDDSN